MKLENRRRYALPAVLLFLLFASFALRAQEAAPASAPGFRTVDFADSEQFLAAKTRHTKLPHTTPAVERLLKQMTLKEKIGQMTQLEIGMVSDGVDAAIRINPKEIEFADTDCKLSGIIGP